MRISVDDASDSDVRVAELAAKYQIETTFYWPVEWHSLAYSKGFEPLLFSEAVDIASNFRIGSHTISHSLLTKIPIEQAKYEISESKPMLEDLLGVEIDSFCPPRGYTTPELSEYILEIYDTQRLTRGYDSSGNKLVHVHPDSGANNNLYWTDCIIENSHLWMHSFELDRFSLWEELEEVLQRYVNV